MALVVNKNLSAMSAHRYLKQNENSFSKSIERLSSGMKINRAADDPAGLVISEKFRAQVEGLQQATRNAQDGISLVQTAEGALDEVTTALRGMRKLALHASNTGASDSAARAADQEQIEKAISTINRIANTTAFGNRKLIDGSAGVTGTAANDNLTFVSGSTNTVAGTYEVDVTTESEKGISAGNAAMTDVTGFTLDSLGTVGDGDFSAGDQFTLSGALFNNEEVTVTLNAGTEEAIEEATKSAIEQHFGISGVTVTFTDNPGDASTLQIAGLNQVAEDANASWSVSDGTGGFSGAAQDATATASDVTGDTRLSQTESVTFRDGEGGNVTVSIAAGTTITNAVGAINDALDNAGYEVTVAFDNANDTCTLTNDDYGASDVVAYSFTSDKDNASSMQLVASAGTEVTIADGSGLGAAGTNAGVNVAGTIGGQAASSSDGIYLSGQAGSDMDGLKVRVDGGSGTFASTVTVENNSLNFQVGAFEGQGVKLQLNDMRGDSLGATATGTFSEMSAINIEQIDVTNHEGAQEALRVIDAALEEVSSTRADMGAFQKDVLEATVRNLNVAAENMAASESTIRDADMAEEMLDFSRAQILQSTSMAMLAQANQAPQSILRLFG